MLFFRLTRDAGGLRGYIVEPHPDSMVCDFEINPNGLPFDMAADHDRVEMECLKMMNDNAESLWAGADCGRNVVLEGGAR